MKSSILTNSFIVIFILSLLIFIGCEDKKTTNGEDPLDLDNVNPFFIDSWDLWELQQTPATAKSSGISKKSSPAVTQRDDSLNPFLVEELYMIIEKHQIKIDDDIYNSSADDIESIHMVDNQIWTIDSEDNETYLYDYYYNDNTEALWLRAEVTADTLYAFDPTDSLGYDLADFMMFFKSNNGPKLDLTEPENNTSIDELEPLFIWESYPSYEYNIQVREDTLFSEEDNFVINEVVIDSINQYQTQPGELENFGNYFWRVKGDNCDWSDVWSFGISIVVELLNPAGGSHIGIKPTFEWSDFDGATEYTIQISEDNYFQNEVITTTIANTYYVHSDTLLSDKKYYWRVKADNTQNNWSETWNFYTDGIITLVEPIDEETEVEIPVVFEWEEMDNTSVYTLEVATDIDFENIVINEEVSGNTYTESGVLVNCNTPYYWRVSSDMAIGSSEIFSFITNNAPLLINPVNDSTDVGVITKFTWGVYTDADDYQIQVDTDVNFSDPLVDSYIYFVAGSPNDTIKCVTSSLISIHSDRTLIDFIPLLVEDFEGDTEYFWRVQRDGLDWSEPWSFTTVSLGGQTNLALPENGEENVWQVPELEWGNSANTTYYRVEVCDESSFTDTLQVNHVTGSISYTINENTEMLLVGEEYYWRVRSDNGNWSDTYSFTVQTGIPYNTSVSVKPETPHKVDLSWAIGYGFHTAFIIERSLDEFTWENIGSVPESGDYIFADLDRDENTTYYYRISTQNPVGYSEPTSTLEITTLSFSLTNQPEMINVTHGTFNMGSNDGEDDEQPVHEVELTHSFELGKYEITNEEYCEILNWALGKGKVKGVFTTANVSGYAPDALNISKILEDATLGYCQVVFNNSESIYKVESGMDNLPITGVTWFGGAMYCNWLSDIDGLTTLYSGTIPLNCNVYGDEGYRFPTEAEWEFCAKGGNSSGEYIYSGSNTVGDVAWYNGNTTEIQPVGQKAANEINTFDMSGNLWEWCNDEYDADYYSTSPATDPTGPGGSTGSYDYMLIRGGSFESEENNLRNANRSNCKANLSYGRVNTSIGFRILKINP